MEAVWGFIGVLLGAAIASGFNWWVIWRSELRRGVAATHALDDEMRALQGDLACAISTRRRPTLDVEPALAVWREQRDAIVLYVDSVLFARIGDGVLASERWARSVADDLKGDCLEAHQINAAKEASALLEQARPTLDSLGAVLRKDHDTFILVSLVVGVWRWVSRRRPLPLKADAGVTEREACA